jgi:hypothetical protein
MVTCSSENSGADRCTRIGQAPPFSCSLGEAKLHDDSHAHRLRRPGKRGGVPHSANGPTCQPANLECQGAKGPQASCARECRAVPTRPMEPSQNETRRCWPATPHLLLRGRPAIVTSGPARAGTFFTIAPRWPADAPVVAVKKHARHRRLTGRAARAGEGSVIEGRSAATSGSRNPLNRCPVLQSAVRSRWSYAHRGPQHFTTQQPLPTVGPSSAGRASAPARQPQPLPSVSGAPMHADDAVSCHLLATRRFQV